MVTSCRQLPTVTCKMKQDLYSYALTSDEDCCLMMMLEFFEDLGLPDDFDQKAFDSLSKKFYDNLK